LQRWFKPLSSPPKPCTLPLQWARKLHCALSFLDLFCGQGFWVERGGKRAAEGLKSGESHFLFFFEKSLNSALE